MATCGQFSHDLLDPRDRPTFDKIRLVRCTIVAIDPRENTVDVEFSEVPPTNFTPPELIDIDCADIPVFDGDGFSDDGERRRFNAVPVFYHCQGSTGTVNELRTGHLAFEVPPLEISSPPYTPAQVTNIHQQVLREKVLLLYIPPSAEDLQEDADHQGYRYVIGHTDRNDIAPCVSEYVCLRIASTYDTDFYLEDGTTPNPNYGHTPPGQTVITIVDCIGRKKYRGLESYGITFPCLASAIIDKTAAIVLDDNTKIEDIAFLDALYTIEPLYDNAFVYGLFNYYESNVLNPDCHLYHPTERLCWMTGFFDYGLQCADTEDKADLAQAYQSCFLWHTNSDDDLPLFIDGFDSTFAIQQYVNVREFLSRPGGIYYRDIHTADIEGAVSGLPAARGTGAEWQISCPGAIDNNEYTVENFIIYNSSSIWQGFYTSGISTASAPRSEVTGTYGYYGCDRTFEHDLAVSSYVPWLEAPFYVAESGEIPENWPGYVLPFRPYINDTMIVIGRKATYGLAALIYDGDHIGANFAYNPDSWYGSTSQRHTSNLHSLEGASTYLKTVLGGMWTMFQPTAVETSDLFGVCSAYVIDVVE